MFCRIGCKGFSKGARSGWIRGFTLLEIVVSLAIIGLILGVVISRMDSYLEWDMKSASNKLASTMRYLYNKAATEGLYIKLVIDIDEGAYWVEATSDPFVVSAGEETGAKPKDAGAGAAEAGPSAPEGGSDEEGEGDHRIKPREAVFTKVDSYLLKPTKLPGSVFFKDVFVEHNPAGVSGGQAVIHFFPNGYVEYALINLRDEKDEANYSLETNPISGRVGIEPAYRRMEAR
ncbi:MAG: prepilin-type N-terminal cleavage/methylation domain-containing protein [Proteobacteria bacterium]|nr:prepilin-type N-terminal cleavage/methylation domain-containing protein [Pseudomonadota bacterium]